MDSFLKFLGAVALIAFVCFVAPLIGVVFGAFAGWVVGLFYAETFHTVREALHLGPMAPWQFGAMVGFVAGFFRAAEATGKKKG